jgi:ribonucleoside-diphosphate reductase alpha chain
MTVFQDEFSKEIWEQNYKYYKDGTVDDTFRRVAKSIASVELTEEKRLEWENNFFDMLSDFKCSVGGRIYANAGTDFKGTSLINCYVSPRAKKDIDSLDNILNGVKNQAFTHKSEGGYGEDFSWIRPRGSFIKSIGVESPGAVKYMELFDKSAEIITAGSGQKKKTVKAKNKIRK